MEILIFLVGISFIFGIYEFNIIIRLKNKVKQSKSSIDVYLTQRFDLIPNLVQCVKAYSEHEKTTLKTLVELREVYNNTKSLKAAESLTQKMNILLARVENVADLKANEQFLLLQKTLIKLESQLQAARRIYNGDVTLYNTTIETFPNSLIANLFNMKTMELFKIDEYKAQNVEVKL